MPVPGLPMSGGTGTIVLRYATTGSVTDQDIFADAGSPTGPVVVLIEVVSGFEFHSSISTLPALDLSTLPAGSHATVVNDGYIAGSGGAGGRGLVFIANTGYRGVSGCGGGGGGRAGGPGGYTSDSDSGVYNGSDGGPSGGGAGGIASSVSGRYGYEINDFFPAEVGVDGGHAISGGSNCTVRVINTGLIWSGGGGGGGGGATHDPQGAEGVGGTGGDVGNDGDPGDGIGTGSNVTAPKVFAVGGAAGFAVYGDNVTVQSDSGDIRGAVGT